MCIIKYKTTIVRVKRINIQCKNVDNIRIANESLMKTYFQWGPYDMT